MMTLNQREITKAGKLLRDGELLQCGYMKRPLLKFSPDDAGPYASKFLNHLRLKQWDYYALTTGDWFFSAGIAHVGYMGLAFAYFIDFQKRSMSETHRATPFGRGVSMPPASESGDCTFKDGPVSLIFERREKSRRLVIDWPRYNPGAHLKADLLVHQPRQEEGLVTATPMEKRRFFYSHKISCMPTEGRLEIGNKLYEVGCAHDLCCLDWGRGVWPYKTFWIWANASGRTADGELLGFNLGNGFGVLNNSTDNCFFVGGKMTKLGWVHIEYDPGDPMKPWLFRSDDKRLELVFTPFFHRPSKVNLLLIKTEAHQMFGRYKGRLLCDSGEKYEVADLVGWAEHHHARW